MILTLIDKILKINGNIIIHDFFSNNMIKTKYKHAENVYCYKQDIIKLFTFNPLYIEIYKFLFIIALYPFSLIIQRHACC